MKRLKKWWKKWKLRRKMKCLAKQDPFIYD
jgi:hypothetical protein